MYFGTKIRPMDVFGVLDIEVDVQDFRCRYLEMNSVDVNPIYKVLDVP